MGCEYLKRIRTIYK